MKNTNDSSEKKNAQNDFDSCYKNTLSITNQATLIQNGKKSVLTCNIFYGNIYLYLNTSHMYKLSKRSLYMKIINQLGYVRELLGISQEQLARKTGISRHTISEIELQKRVPTLFTALLLSKALNCKVDEIFFIKKER